MARTSTHWLIRFLIRWLVSGLGLWIGSAILGSEHLSIGDHSFSTILWAGLILAIVNATLKPILVLLSLPAILLTLGLFMIVVNGLTVLIAAKLYGPLTVSSFGWAMVAGLIIGFVNYLVTHVLETNSGNKSKK